jgi:isopentenyl-diphosphate delta-isomerase type 1
MNILKEKRVMGNKPVTEYFDLVDPHGTVIGRASREECHSDRSRIHRTVHVIVCSAQGDILLQKRSPLKTIQPGKWDTSVGGHVLSGESIDHAVEREINEELGISSRSADFTFLYEYLWESEVETELVSTFYIENNGPFTYDKDEITEIRFWSRDEITNSLGKGVLTPNFEFEFKKFTVLD